MFSFYFVESRCHVCLPQNELGARAFYGRRPPHVPPYGAKRKEKDPRTVRGRLIGIGQFKYVFVIISALPSLALVIFDGQGAIWYMFSLL